MHVAPVQQVFRTLFCVAIFVGLAVQSSYGQETTVPKLDFSGDLGKNGLGLPRTAPAAQKASNVQISAQFEIDKQVSTAYVVVTANIEEGWHIYSITQPAGGPLKTRLSVSSDSLADPAAPISWVPSKEPHRRIETQIKAWHGLTIEEHEGTISWSALVPLKSGLKAEDIQIDVSASGQVCQDECIRWSDSVTAEFTNMVESFSTPVTPPEPRSVIESAMPPSPEPSSAPAVAPPPSKPVVKGTARLAFWQAALFGIVGGLILNVMPCVLPVIGLKVLGFAEQAGQNRGRILALNLWYTAGLMSVFLVLAAMAAFLQMGWSSAFGSETFRYVMLGGVFVMGLSFLGVWEIPIPGFASTSTTEGLQEKEGAVGAFSKGVFTTILATPCSGPFLGSVFFYTAEAAWYETFAIFGCVGLGMAMPYLLVGVEPRLVKWLPKPGAWMETFKQAMGFVLLATAIYLFQTVQHPGNVVAVLTMLLGLAVACWWIGRVPAYAETSQKLSGWASGATMAALISLAGFYFFASPITPQIPGTTTVANVGNHLFEWQPYSPEALEKARAEGKTIMLDFTASWCPNCHFNTQFAIDTPEVKELVERNGVVAMLADWSDHGPVVEAKLKELGGNTIPFLAIYSAQRPDEVTVLPDVITKGQLLQALEEAGPSKSQVAVETNVATRKTAMITP